MHVLLYISTYNKSEQIVGQSLFDSTSLTWCKKTNIFRLYTHMAEKEIRKLNEGKQIPTNICIFQISFLQWCWPQFEGFFSAWCNLSVCQIWSFTDTGTVFLLIDATFLANMWCKYCSFNIWTVAHQSELELSDLDWNWAKTRHLLFKTFEISNFHFYNGIAA